MMDSLNSSTNISFDSTRQINNLEGDILTTLSNKTILEVSSKIFFVCSSEINSPFNNLVHLPFYNNSWPEWGRPFDFIRSLEGTKEQLSGIGQNVKFKWSV